MAERQKHGFVFQKKVEELFNYETDPNYTAKWDMVIDSTLYSIKNIKIGAAVELGSLRRFYENTEPFKMIIGWHDTKQIHGVEEINFTSEVLSELKGTIKPETVYKACDTLTLSNFPVGHHEEARSYFKTWKAKYASELGALTVTGKVDSKSQRRWQCNINRTQWKRLFGNISTETLYKGYNFSELRW